MAQSYLCGSTMNQATVAALLDNERKRALLGADEDPGRLAALGSAVDPDIAIKRLAAEFAGSLAGSVPKCKGTS